MASKATWVFKPPPPYVIGLRGKINNNKIGYVKYVVIIAQDLKDLYQIAEGYAELIKLKM